MKSVSQLPWLWARLRAMSPQELGWRVRERFQTAWESRRAGSERFCPLPAPRADELRESLRRSLEPLRPAPEWRASFGKEFPQAQARLQVLADETLGGSLPVFARTFKIEEQTDWHRDPAFQHSAPQAAAARINYRNADLVGSARRIWEVNRHHHLVELSMWAWISRDPKYGEYVVEQLEDWCRANPPLWGINWTSSLELAIRTLAWAEILALLIDTEDPSLTNEKLELLVGAWVRQIEHIRLHDSRFSSANNHRIGEAAAVAAAGLLLPFHPRAAGWWSWGREVLNMETLLQIASDGVGREQAFSYQRFVLDFLILIRVLARSKQTDLDPDAIDRIGRACEFLSSVTRPDGSLVSIGDDDEGRAFALGEAWEERTLATLETAAWLYENPEWRRGSFARAHWLGVAPATVGMAPASVPPPQNKLECLTYREGGYAIVRGGLKGNAFHLIMDAGPLGYGRLAAHGHADALSLACWVGEEVLIDPGTGSYHGNPAWRESLRGTDAHNTCQVDGQDQSERRGLFLWGRRAQARLLASGTQEPWFILAGAHDGYAGQGIPELRRIVAGYAHDNEVVLIVVDELIGNDRHEFRVPWHLGRGEVLPRDDQSSWRVAFPRGTRLDARAAVLGRHEGLRHGAVMGGDPRGIWFSPRFEEREPGSCLYLETGAELPAGVLWFLRIQCGEGDRPLESTGDLIIEACDSGLACRLEMGESGTLRALVSSPTAEGVQQGNTRLQGRLAAWKEGEPGPASGKVVVAGATLFRSGLLAWKSERQPMTGVLSVLAPRADSFVSGPPTSGNDS